MGRFVDWVPDLAQPDPHVWRCRVWPRTQVAASQLAIFELGYYHSAVLVTRRTFLAMDDLSCRDAAWFAHSCASNFDYLPWVVTKFSTVAGLCSQPAIPVARRRRTAAEIRCVNLHSRPCSDVKTGHDTVPEGLSIMEQPTKWYVVLRSASILSRFRVIGRLR